VRSTCVRLLLCAVCLVGLDRAAAQAATYRVCASGCDFSTLQPAIDAAAPGDTLLLRAGETFAGHFVLRAKPLSTQWITIRSDAGDSLLPADGVRLVPSGKPGANTSRALLPRLVGLGGALKTTPVVRTAPGASRYVLKFLEIDGSANLGYETLIALGDDTTAAPAHDLVIDRVYAHGHQYKGMKRGIALNSGRADVLNSYISDIKAVNADSQALAGANGTGPFRIINNYLEGAGENVIFGGSDPAVLNLVPRNIEIRRNHLFKPLEWQNDILAAPGSAQAAASAAAGSLAAGTHYFKIVALMDTDTLTAVSAPSKAVSVFAPGGTAVALSWSAVPGADRYRIYRGSTASAQSVYLETASAGTSFTYTGTAERAGTPAATGTKWTVKNIFELKNAEQVILEGNVLENIWQSGQYGYAIVLTPRNQEGTASWVRVRDVLITNNIVRHAAGVLQLSGTDATNVSQQTQRVTLRNNLFYDIDPQKWGGYAKVFLVGEGPAGVVLDHNTIVHTNSSVVYAYGTKTITGFVYTNNISLHGEYGIMAEGGRPGQYSIDKYFPSSIITNNVLAGGTASLYPAPNAFPTVQQWNASFANIAESDYRLLSSSPFYAAGAGGSIPGADLGAINAAISGDPAPPPPPPPPPPAANTAPTARPGGPYAAVKGVAVTVDGSASVDADGSVTSYRWTWGDEVVVDAADVPASDIVGLRWARVQAPGAARGIALHNPNRNEAKVTAAAASPASYVDVRFHAAAGVPYHLWFRMSAEADSYLNDSMFVQFSGAVDAQGRAVNRIGSTAASAVIVEEGSGAGVSGWGWNDEAYGSLAAPVYFSVSGLQTVRIQQREDGILWDQLVLSAGRYLSTRPGLTRVDTTTVNAADGSGVVASHAYAVAGQYPLVLTVTDDDGAVSAAATTVSAGDAAAILTARAGGPYAGTATQSVTFDATTSTIPPGVAPQFLWAFGDDVVLHAPAVQIQGGRWKAVADPTAATGTAIENADAAEPKIATALSNPASYIEAAFRAAPGVPYRLWIRMRADRDSYSNDSVHVQFSGSVNSAGAPSTRIGSADAFGVVLEEGSGAGVQGWGWGDASYGGMAAPIFFNQDGLQRIRIQQREDGIRIDQIVISADRYFDAAPGSSKADATIVPVSGPGATGPVVEHVYRGPGSYPVTLTVVAGPAGTAVDGTVAVIR
jgi:hypothetical protein